DVVERTHGRLATRARALEADLPGLHAMVERGAAGLLGGDLGGERSRLARPAETGTPGSGAAPGVALAVGGHDDGDVERIVDVGDAVGDDALDLLLRLGGGRLGH